jgi:O-Antigen ligase
MMTATAFAHQAGFRHRVALTGSAISVLGVLILLSGFHGVGAVLLLTGIGILTIASPLAAIWAILLLVPFHPIAMRTLQVFGFSGWPFLAVSAWKELVLSLALIALVVDVAQRIRVRGTPIGRPTEIGDYLAGGLLLLVGFAVLIDPSVQAINGARLMLFPVGMYVAVRLQPIPSARALLALALVGATIAAFGIVQSSWLGWDFVQRYYVGPGLPIPAIFSAQFLEGPRAAGTFLSPNVFAFVVASYLSMATALVLRARSRTKVMLAPVLVLLVVGVVVTFSRSALIGSALGLGAIVLIGARRHSLQPRRTALVLLFAFVPALALSAVVYADRGGFTLLKSTIAAIDGVGAGISPSAPPTSPDSPAPGASPVPSGVGAGQPPDPSTIGHVASLAQGWQLVVAHPLGVGLGNVGARPFPGSTEQPTYVVESWYLAMGLSLGWLGLVWALVFPAALGLAAIRALNRERAVLSALVALGLAALVAFVSLLLPTMQEPEVAMLPWVIFGLLAVRKQSRPPVAPADAPALAEAEA